VDFTDPILFDGVPIAATTGTLAVRLSDGGEKRFVIYNADLLQDAATPNLFYRVGAPLVDRF
jgi:hypothetical protein